MSENILTTFMTVVGSGLTSLVLVNWRLTKLEQKVDQHNKYSDKIASMTTDIALIKQDISYIKEKLGGK